MTGLRARAAALALVAGAALAVPATPARAAACSSGSGVTVVVDFAALGGGTQTRCAAGDPASGVTALRGAGFEPTRAAQQPGYFVCRIDGKPASDPCQRTSPEDAYWSYWHARPGGSWAYSSTGPNDYDPAPGTVEGWAFGAGKPPSSPPPSAAAAAPSPSPRPAATSPRAQPPPVRSSPAAAPARTPVAVAAATPVPATPAPSPPASPVRVSAGATPVPVPLATPAPTSAAVSAPAAPADDDGSTTGPLLAGLLLAALGLAGARQARLRRRGR